MDLTHYDRAVALLEEGVRVVDRIAHAPDRHTGAELERYRDGLGKKAMGIWAQAQVHATLALVDVQGSGSS